MKLQLKAAASALAVSTMLVTGAVAEEKEPIKIGFAIAESGWLANYDIPPFKSAVLKIEEINAAGGLLGRKIEYEVRDTKTDLALAATMGEELISSGINLLIIPSDYDYGSPAALAAVRENVIAMSPGAADPKMGVQGVGPTVFTVHGAAQTEGIVMAEYALDKLSVKDVYMLEDVSISYSKSACAGFAAAWTAKAKPETILGRDTFKNDDPSIASQITRIKSLGKEPGAIFMCSYTPGGAAAVRQIRAAGLDMPIISTTGMSDNYWLSAVPDLTNFYVPAIMSLKGDDPRPAVNKYVETYRKRWNEDLSSSFGILGYTAIEEWALAVERAGTTDTDAVLAEMNKFKDEDFAIGLTSFTDQLHVQVDRPTLVMMAKDGAFKPMELYRNTFVPDLNLLLRASQ